MQNDNCLRRWAAILACVLVPAAAPSHASAHLSLPLLIQSRAPNATPLPPPPVREAARCIGYYQPCGRGPFHCCAGLQCLPLTNTGSVCGPPPHRR